MAYDPKDDVDRLFACFKCGVSPPQSALRERKRYKERENSIKETPSTSSKCEKKSSSEIGMAKSALIKFTRGKQISPVVFYGSPQGVPLKKPTHLLRLLREIRIDLNKQNDLIPSKEVWVTFPRQEEAIRFCKANANCYVFSYQDHLTSQRRFLVSTYDEFWRRYKNMDSKLCHHYEVIQEGLPCHLYFDLEFEKKINTGKNVDEMVYKLVLIIFDILFEKYSIQGSEEWVVELDSSTNQKFSRHLIIRIPNTAFKDNSHAGAFVSEVCSRTASQRVTDPKLNELYINKDTSGAGTGTSYTENIFLDQAVYSRNRCFRLVYSSKSGKNSFLVPTGRFKCKNLSEKEVFMDSLICRMDSECDKLLICKMDLDCKKILCFDSEVQETSLGAPLDTYRSDFPSTYLSGKSPFPALDSFIESIASIGNVSGKIRSWYWFSAYGLMVYSMLRSRYCERIGREHKSNHVMYIVDFQRAGYYQKCYDPDCRGYRSPLRPLPWEIIPDHTSILKSNQEQNSTEVMDIDFDIQLDCDENMKNNENCIEGKSIVDSSMKDNSWWQEAVKFADCIEKMKDGPGLSNLGEDNGEDSKFWMDAEKFASQFEEQIS